MGAALWLLAEEEHVETLESHELCTGERSALSETRQSSRTSIKRTVKACGVAGVRVHDMGLVGMRCGLVRMGYGEAWCVRARTRTCSMVGMAASRSGS